MPGTNKGGFLRRTKRSKSLGNESRKNLHASARLHVIARQSYCRRGGLENLVDRLVSETQTSLDLACSARSLLDLSPSPSRTPAPYCSLVKGIKSKRTRSHQEGRSRSSRNPTFIATPPRPPFSRSSPPTRNPPSSEA